MLEFRVRDHVSDADVILALRCMLFLVSSEAIWEPYECRWQMSESNDIWLHPNGEHQYRLRFRSPDPDLLKAFAIVFARRFGAEILSIA